MSLGYKPQMHNGVREFCRRQGVTGSRTTTVMHCGTVEQLMAETRLAREFSENSEKPTGASVVPAQVGH